MNVNRDKTRKLASRRLAGALLALLCLGASASAVASTLQAIEANTLSGGAMEVRLRFAGAAPDTKGYSIEKPARIALDLLGADSDIKSKRQNLGSGNARSVNIVEAKDKTRLVFNLEKVTGYSTQKEGDELVVLLGHDSKKTEASNKGVDSAKKGAAVKNIDFRRGDEGQGRVIIKLSDPSIPVDVKKEGGEIIARFVGAGVDNSLVRKLDVTDFATPVRVVDTQSGADSTLVKIQPSGHWEYLAYQTDSTFSIDVKPLSKTEQKQKKDDAFQYTGEKLSLNFQDIEVRSVLQLIADFTGLNLVASDTVSGSITLRLKNVPWDQALDLILKTKGLDKRKVGNVLLVAPADEIAAREQLELESKKKTQALAPLRTEYIDINYANAAELKALINSAGGEEGSLLTSRGSVVVDERTNTLILQDTQKKLEEAKALIDRLDIPVQQVLIEARVVVASNDISDEFGVRWGGLNYNASSMVKKGESGLLSGRLQSLRDLHKTNVDKDYNDDGSVELEFEIPEEGDDRNDDLMVDLGVDSDNASRFAVGFTSLASGLIELELSALEAEGHGELVATPKVLTADQQAAVIASGQRIPYNKSTSSGATAIEYIEAELRLEVTPHITPDGDIVMTLKVNNDAVSGFQNDTPVIDSRRVETSVLVGDGETVVLGGIFQQEKINSVTKTPFLGDLPWIGTLFRKTVKRDNKQELLIFITPRLMNDTVAAG